MTTVELGAKFRKFLAAMLLLTGITVVVTGTILAAGLVAPNHTFGIRFPQAFASADNWFRLNRFGGIALALWGGRAWGLGVCCFRISGFLEKQP